MIGTICGETPLTSLLSAKDHPNQYKFLHRVYLTPARLAKFFPSQSSACWHCSAAQADFIHIFWDCTLSVLTGCSAMCSGDVTTLHIYSIAICLLDLVDSLAPKKVICTLLSFVILLCQENHFFYSYVMWKGTYIKLVLSRWMLLHHKRSSCIM